MCVVVILVINLFLVFWENNLIVYIKILFYRGEICGYWRIENCLEFRGFFFEFYRIFNVFLENLGFVVGSGLVNG